MPLMNKTVYGFIAGEVSPDFYGRSDLSKYDLGVAQAQNFMVDYRGGLMSRGGFEMCVPVQKATQAHRLFTFSATGDDYLLLFGDKYIRPMRNGGYLLETAKTITAFTTNLITSTAHGFVDNDIVYVSGIVGRVEANNRYYEVYAALANSFRLRLIDGGLLDVSTFSAYVSGGNAQRVVTIVAPYDAEDLYKVSFEQQNNECRITHSKYGPRKLLYVSDVNWQLSNVQIGGGPSAPTSLVATPSAAGTAGVAFSVTSFANSIEGVPSSYAFATSSVDYTAVPGSLRLEWAPVSGAQEYYIYRTLLLPIGSEISYAQDMGYLGRAIGPQFTDNNVIPDFTKSPPIYYNPCGVLQIEEISVTAGGAGYTNLSVVSVTDAEGVDFAGYPVVSPAGVLLSVLIVNPGKNYLSPIVSVSIGAGATFSVSLGPATGTYPSLFKVFQQRGIYASTVNEPMRVWASKPGDLNNFDVSPIVNAGDGYSFQLDSREIRPIQHILALRTGLLLFSSRTITILRAEEGKAISGVSALAEPQAYKGVNDATPVAIDLDVVFAQRGSSAVNVMMYTEYTNSFQMQDVAILANHLMGVGKEITRMMWQAEPHKLLWALRKDGVLLSMTYEREQAVFAWSHHVTQGKFLDIATAVEGSADELYVVAERFLNGGWVKFVERLAPRDVSIAEDYFGVDCGFKRVLTSPTASISVSTEYVLEDYWVEGYLISVNVYTLTASSSSFSGTVAGDVIYFAGGKFEITQRNSNTEVEGFFIREPTNRLHISGVLCKVAEGDWQLGSPISTLTGLSHLEGETVSLNIDGDCYLNQVVVDGRLTLPRSAVKVSVGLQYMCDARTLPPVFAEAATEGRVHSIVSAAVRLHNTRGMSFGKDIDDLIEMKDKGHEDWGDEIALLSGTEEVLLSMNYEINGSVFFRQAYPLPAKVLGFSWKVDVGDE